MLKVLGIALLSMVALATNVVAQSQGPSMPCYPDRVDFQEYVGVAQPGQCPVDSYMDMQCVESCYDALANKLSWLKSHYEILLASDWVTYYVHPVSACHDAWLASHQTIQDWQAYCDCCCAAVATYNTYSAQDMAAYVRAAQAAYTDFTTCTEGCCTGTPFKAFVSMCSFSGKTDPILNPMRYHRATRI